MGVAYTCAVKRWTLRIILCMILGAITTVAVAWGIVATFNPIDENLVADGYSSFGEASAAFGWRLQVTSGTGRATVLSVMGAYMAPNLVNEKLLQMPAAESVAPAWSAARSRPPESPIQKRTIERANGWPILALHGEITTTNALTVTDSSAAVVIEGNPWYRSRILSLRPIWPGFLIDTLFYTAIWFGVFLGFTSAKRYIRAKRGRCPRCGYDLRGALDHGCSECGWNRADEVVKGAT